MTSKPGKRQYSTFVSYSHADSRIGAKLFRWLDAYRPPKALIGRQTPFGAVPKTLHPCFRDREELSASRDVASSLDDALTASGHLVILCSPAAARSEWVAHEIKTFVALRGADRVHTVIVDGEPDKAFPVALKAAGIVSPLAADLRRQGDGWKDGRTKLVASVLGVPFGELKDREQLRARARTRVAAGITSAFAALFVSACGASWVALDRVEAAQDAFVGLMRQISTPLDRLVEGQGKTMTTGEAGTDIAVAQALTDAAFAMAPDSSRLLDEEARLLLVQARYFLAIGQSVNAMEKVQRSVALYQRMESRRPLDPPTMRMFASALRTEGGIFKTRGNFTRAKASLQQSVSILRSLQGPPDARTIEDIALALNALADMADQKRDYVEAAELHASVLALGAGQSNPDVRRQFVITQAANGDKLIDGRDYQAAKTVFGIALTEARKLATADPADRRIRRDVAVYLERIGSISLMMKQTAPARQSIDEATQILTALAESDPLDKQVQSDLLVVRWWSTRISAEERGEDVSFADLRAQRAAAETLARIDPNNLRWSVDSARNIAEVLYYGRTGERLDVLAYDAGEIMLDELRRENMDVPQNVAEALLARSRPRLDPSPSAPMSPPPSPG